MGKKKEAIRKTVKTSIEKNKDKKEKKVGKKVSLKENPGKEKPGETKEKPNVKIIAMKKAKDEKKPGPKKPVSPGKMTSTKDDPGKSAKTPRKPRKPSSAKPKSGSPPDSTPSIPEIMNVESSKFEMEPPKYRRDSISIPPAPPHDLPMGYGDTKVVILVRDPEWIFAYWEINDKSRLNHNLPRGRHDKTLALRIFDVTGVKFNGANAHRFYDIIINDYAVSWYLRMPEVNRSWCVDLGYYDTRSGNFITLARSNIVTTPPGSISPKGDDEWMQVTGEQYEEILRLSGGLDIKDFRGSENLLRSISEKIKLQVERSQGASGGVTSSQVGSGRRDTGENSFWLTVNTDLIVYGATQPGALVTIRGKKVPVREDGTFSVYFSLPEGIQIIPVKAVNAGKNREREITPKITKETR